MKRPARSGKRPRTRRQLGHVLKLRASATAPFTWTVARPTSESKWRHDLSADVFFIHVDDVERWQAGRLAVVRIPAGLWQVQKSGTIKVVAPEVGLAPPFRIPPGRYYIIVEWDFLSAATVDAVDIPAPERPAMSNEEVRSRMGEMQQNVGRKPNVQSERTKGGRVFIRFRGPEGQAEEDDEEPPKTPKYRPPGVGTNASRDKVDPFPDVASAMPKLVSDIRRARENIWIAWWALEDDFPTAYALTPGGSPIRPSRYLRQEIQSALAANPSLQVYILLWDNPLQSRKPDPSKFSNPADRPRLHFEWQSNDVIGSHHEKFLLMDLAPEGSEDEGAVLWCLGWNGEIVYWDNHFHKDPDPFRDGVGHEHQPWHDSAIRVVSKKASLALEEEFRRRWQFPPALPTPPPIFRPLPVGNTSAVPLVHKEWTVNGPIEGWYVVRINRATEGFYIENQYFGDLPSGFGGRPARFLTKLIINVYLSRERAGKALHAAIVLCHPEVMSPFLMKLSSRENLATIRAHTARRLDLKTAAGITPCNRPAGGWTKVAVTGWWMISNVSYVSVTGPGFGGSGELVRAIGGVICLTMVTPDISGAPRFRAVYLHSKMAVADGEYTIGSCNTSVNSFVFDSETNVAVPDPTETKRLMTLFFPNLVGGTAAGNLSTWINLMDKISAGNYDMEHNGKLPWAPVGLLTEFPYD